jgi:hypothetical protein
MDRLAHKDEPGPRAGTAPGGTTAPTPPEAPPPVS